MTAESPSLAFLHRLRAAEVDVASPWVPPGARVLELGGSDGYQASLLRARGHEVSSIDLSGRPRSEHVFHEVLDYDGVRIPFADRSFDIVFSSNVLEHIPHLPDTLDEIRRVLRPGGLAIHLVPSSSWRLWTTLAHYPWLATYPLRARAPRSYASPRLEDSVAHNTPLQLAKKALGLAPHGAYPHALSELYYFRRRRWERFLRAHGFDLVHSGSNHLFYTGYTLLPGLPVTSRRQLSRWLGGSCHLFVTRVASADARRTTPTSP